MDHETDPLPRVTESQLRRALDDRSCSLRLAKEHAGKKGAWSPSPGFAVSNRILADARQAHAERRDATARDFPGVRDLLPEQQRLYGAAARAYLALFADRPVVVVDDLDEWATVDPDTGVELVGSPGLPVDADGSPELRVLSLRGDDRPLVDAARRSFLLLRTAAWTAGRPLRIVAADLVAGHLEQHIVDTATEQAGAHRRLAERVEQIRRRIADPAPSPGRDCASCRYVAECGAHR